MKKLMLMVAVVMVGFLSYAGEVIKDGSGYQDFPWGSTPEQVKVKYPELEDIRDTVYGRMYSYEKNRMDIRFFFKENKLKKVHVVYADAKIVKKTILDKLTETYGAPSKVLSYKYSILSVTLYLWELKKGGIYTEYRVTGDIITLWVEYMEKEEFAKQIEERVDKSYIRIDTGDIGL